MTLVRPASRAAIHVPLVDFAVAGLVALAAALIGRPGYGGVLAGLLAAVLFVFACGNVRVLRARDARLHVTSLFRRDAFAAAACVFGVAPVPSARMVRYRVYVADRAHRRDLAEVASEGQGDELVRRLLRDLLGRAPGEAGASSVEADVSAERAEWKGAQAVAQAQVSTYYASTTHRRRVWWMLIAVAVYGLAMLLYTLASGRHP